MYIIINKEMTCRCVSACSLNSSVDTSLKEYYPDFKYVLELCSKTKGISQRCGITRMPGDPFYSCDYKYVNEDPFTDAGL